MRDYDNFKLLAFNQYGIPPQILEVVRPWVEEQCRHGFYHKEDDLGYAELADITTLDKALKILQEDLKIQKIEGKRNYNKYLKDAGGRVGKGFYRWTLKAYYLSGSQK